MAKKQRGSIVTASFHVLVKCTESGPRNEPWIDSPFSVAEFEKVVRRISDTSPIDENNSAVIEKIKRGEDLPFSGYELHQGSVHFGNFDGAYYGQQFRNNVHGVITADSLNLRPFNYLITRLSDGRILVGVTYTGQYGDYDGMRRCLTHMLKGNFRIVSRSVTSVIDEIGNGIPTEIRLTYRNSSSRPERRGLFGKTGAVAIKRADYGDGFDEEVSRIARSVVGNQASKKRTLANIVNQGNIIEIDDDDIVGCTAIVRENGRYTTVYLLGENTMATRFPLRVQIDSSGIPNRTQVRDEMVRVMRERVIPLLSQ